MKITALDIHHYLKNNIRRRRSNSPRPARNRPASDPTGQIRRRNPRNPRCPNCKSGKKQKFKTLQKINITFLAISDLNWVN